MGYFKGIKLRFYRNFIDSSFEFDKGCNIIIGKNGSGKTNILESLSLLEKGRGFKKEKLNNLINYEAQDKNFHIRSTFYHEDIDYNADVFSINQNERNLKKMLINGSDDRDSLKHFENLVSFIYFLPEMERLFVSSPLSRRNFIDRLIYTKDKTYNLLIIKYKKLIHERQQILKNSHYDEMWIDKLENDIVNFGIEIYKKRFRQIHILNSILLKLDIVQNLSFKYILKLTDIFVEKNLNTDDLDKKFFSIALKKNRKIDTLTGGCAIGPHRSDIIGYKLNTNFGINQFSTGQQKTAILLIIIAQCKYLIEENNLKPIILLDEICSHLDNDNRELLLYLIDKLDVQVFMTGTDKNLFSFLSTKAYYCNIT
ncbi:DNA replication and repair protein RecF [Alphaproteobacteria bacterium]|nr:DNA replication and repair protein RecF [Alphaproteobacteria bacterium]